jgi:2-polyprenyl-6-methoxyphenol hydroxylase-like FAD-dependent oxidoreductase
VTLVGDAGYGPGPAVGGGTTLAVVGAYVLAGELAEAGGDHERGFAAYERELRDYVQQCRERGQRSARTLVPRGRVQLFAFLQGVRIFSHLPNAVIRALTRIRGGREGLHDSVILKEYSTACG